MKKIYIKERKNIAFYNTKATQNFWNNHWEIDKLERYIISCQSDEHFIPLIKKYLPKGSTVLEGGCGIGQFVHALKYNGFNAIGIDFASETIKAVKSIIPELDVRVGDVRNLADIDDKYLDGYLSIGVIEHLWNGYNNIISEMARTIKQNGYLFISFPYMSPLRKMKALVRLYPVQSVSQILENDFYQFALNHKKVIHSLNSCGFSLIEKIHFDGIKGFKDELPIFRSYLQNVYNGTKHQRFRKYLDKLLRPYAAHCIILVMQKKDT
jgi:SAM-dependent methyltransferase